MGDRWHPAGRGPWLDKPLQGSKTKRWISSCLWPTGDAVCSVFFALLSVLRTIGHPFAEDLWARARGGEGAKNDRSPRRGTGIRASRPRPLCPGLDGQGAPWACHLFDAARHRRDGDVLRCDIWTWTRRGEPKPPPAGRRMIFIVSPSRTERMILPFSPSGNVESICGLVSGSARGLAPDCRLSHVAVHVPGQKNLGEMHELKTRVEGAS